ncbi:MAG: FHA domain-containing protein, partial [Gemmatimonadaceae bacterium]
MAYLQHHDARFDLANGETRVGRGTDADVRLPAAPPEDGPPGTAVAVVAVAGDGSAAVRHQSGQGGVFVNGVPVGQEPASLLHGDRLTIDGCDLHFADEAQSGVTQEFPIPLLESSAVPSPGVALARSRGRLVSLTDGREYSIRREGIVVGREAGCDVVIAALTVSRRHAKITPLAGGYELLDTSSNGILVNGARVHGSLPLARGDTVKIGPDEFRFYADADAPAPRLGLHEVPSLQSTAAIAAVKRPLAAGGAASVTESHAAGAAVPGHGAASSDASEPTRPSSARRALPLAVLEVLNEGAGKGYRYELAAPLCHVGRGAHNDVVVHDESVSESHAKLQRREDGWYVVDMDSTNGTYLGGERVFGELRLTTGAVVRFGGVKMSFRATGGAQKPSGSTRVIVGLR